MKTITLASVPEDDLNLHSVAIDMAHDQTNRTVHSKIDTLDAHADCRGRIAGGVGEKPPPKKAAAVRQVCVDSASW